MRACRRPPAAPAPPPLRETQAGGRPAPRPRAHSASPAWTGWSAVDMPESPPDPTERLRAPRCLSAWPGSAGSCRCLRSAADLQDSP